MSVKTGSLSWGPTRYELFLEANGGMDYSAAFPATLQEYFDIAWRRANEMEKPSVVASNVPKVFGQVRYRCPDGRCLIGAAIPDEVYTEAMEGIHASRMLGVIGVKVDFLNKLDHLQSCHDDTCGLPGFKPRMIDKLRAFAATNGLTIPPDARALEK